MLHLKSEVAPLFPLVCVCVCMWDTIFECLVHLLSEYQAQSALGGA